MAPKRKRNDRGPDTGGRPAPHRPSDTVLGQHDRDVQDPNTTPNRRVSGGGRVTRRNPDRRDSSGSHLAGPSSNRGPPSPSIPRPPSSASHVVPPGGAATQTHPTVPSHYNYLVLTEARLASWQLSGRREVIEHGIKSRDDEDVEEISTISQEFIRAVLEHRLTSLDAGTCVKQILGPYAKNTDDSEFVFDAHSLFLDTVSIFFESEEASSIPLLRDFLASTEIPPSRFRELLDVQTLHQIGLTRDTFFKLGIRYATNQLYRQANYNLLREESEGYSKLAAELYRTPYHSREYHDFALAQACWERVKGLIGTFDLDVGRVLDVTIDVFSATMLRNIIFFTKFLRLSSWWPRSQIEHAERVFAGGLPKWALPQYEDVSAEDMSTELAEQCYRRDLDFWDRAREVHINAFFELGGRRAEEADMHRSRGTASGAQTSDSYLEWMTTTKTLPPCGNRVAAQILGFKFRFYASDARSKGETLPANLYYLAAFLIKIGFIALPDLYPHLWPADEQMDSIKTRRQQELEDKERAVRQGNEPNALLMAGALPDEDKVVRPREAMISRPEVKGKDGSTSAQAEEDTSLPEPKEAQKADIVSHLLVAGAIPEALFILGKFPWLPEAYPDEIYPAVNRILSHSISKVYEETKPKEVHGIVSNPLKSIVAQDQSGVPKGSVRLEYSPPVKILKWPHVDGTAKGSLYRFYLDEWSDNVPVCQTVDDVFTLCSSLLNVSGVNIGREPTLVKKLAAIGRKSLMQDQSPENRSRWQDLLRRLLVPALCLGSSNVDTVAAVWDLLKQFPTVSRYNIYAECYEGQISRLPAMVKAFKRSRLDTLATLKRLALDNIPASAKRLAKVALAAPGVVCKVSLEQIEAYSNLIEAFVECTKYFTDLGYDVLVWSLLSSLGGKQRSRTQATSILLTSRWLQALSKFSGRVFRRYSNMNPTPVIQYVNDQVASGNSTDLVILKELITSMGGIVSDIDFTDAQVTALSGGERLRRLTLTALGDKRYESAKSASRFMKALMRTDTASQLLTNIAQYRQSAIYNLPEEEAHIKYIATVLDDSHQALVQYVELLRSNLSPEAFDALIPSIPSLMTEFGLDANIAFLIGRTSLTYFMTNPGEKMASVALANAMDVDVDSASVAKEDPQAVLAEQSQSPGDPMVVEEKTASQQESSATTNGHRSDRFLDVLGPIVSAVRPLWPSEVWNKISPEFFAVFWALQTSDLAVPEESYEAELTRPGPSGKRSDDDALRKEMDTCKERVSKTRFLLTKQSSIWFSSSAKADSIADTIIEECLIPRILTTPADADFCHRFVHFLHNSRGPHFRLSNLYDQFFGANKLRSLIFGCTVREAEFLGRFLKLTLGDLANWHKDKTRYEDHGKFGFPLTFDDNGKPLSFMEHDQFRDLLWTWHRNLSSALKACLGGTEWMHIRNAITILKTCLEHFPAVDFMGKQFQQLLGKIAEREAASKTASEDGQSHRVDLSVAANTAISALKRYSNKWVIVQSFRSNTSGDATEEKNTAETNKTGQPLGLRPNAPEFKPRTSTSARTKANDEEEDGEVKDVRLQSAKAPSSGAAVRDTKPVVTGSQQDSGQKLAATPQRPETLAAPPRSSTPKAITAPAVPALTPRQNPPRQSTLAPTPSGLPKRPEVSFPTHFTQDQYGQIKSSHPHQRDSREPRDNRETRDSRDVRDSRDAKDSRDQRPLRPVDDPRPGRGRDPPSADRRGPDNMTRESPRGERDRTVHRSDSARRPEQNAQDRDTRMPRERPPQPAPSGRTNTEPAKGTRDSPGATKAMPPPPPPDPQGPPINPERARMMNVERPDDRSNLINPQRAALISEPKAANRPGREDSRDRNSIRPPSPRRGDRSDSRIGESRDDRPARSHRAEDHGPPRHHRGDPVPSTGPKSSRNTDLEGDRQLHDRPRETASQQQHNSRAEPDHGRVNNQDPNYGRLSAIPSITDASHPPDGPRGRGRSTRAPMGNPPMQSGELQRPGSPDRHQPPTGPASSRPRRNQPSGQYNPSTPAPQPATAPPGSVHPERLGRLNVMQGTPPAPSFSSSSANSVPVHPDRMNHIGPGPSPAGPPIRHASRQDLPPLHTPERPPITGPPAHRQPSGNHTAMQPRDTNSPISAPTGPASSNERSRTGGRRQLSGINNILAGGQGGTSVRLKTSRTNLAGSDAQVLTGASPVSTPSHERHDPMIPNERGGHSERPSRNDYDRARRDHENIDRSSRSSRRTSRERSPERDSRTKDHRDYRDRKSGLPERESSRRSGRELPPSSRESMPGSGRSEPVSGGREGLRESRHRVDGGGGRHVDHDQAGGGRGSNRSGGIPRSDERRDPRGGEDRGRKRRSEDFNGPGAEKRQRR
ncbi:hypothetical protein F4778DRAFT_786210 [Xylariomycetidae sp. FL2044]|nr:hypothetical protein F4778DRAFT_786210 [Xylariomycetidae sp. FL2044]